VAHAAWPEPLRVAFAHAVTEAISLQRDLAVAEEESARSVIEKEGGEIIELSPAERDAFARAVAPMHDEARIRFGSEMFGWL
jgi:TRAP-type C4-dicarboxylate transport system substrate-binding protein